MKNILLYAAVALPVAVMTTSCSSTGTATSSASSSTLKVLTKKQVSPVSKGWSSSSPDGFLPSSPSVALKDASAAMQKDKHGMPTYKLSQRNRVVRTTAYSHMEMEPGAPGRMNAAGTILKYGTVRSAAADWSVYPIGTTFKIKGLPHTYVVDDYGSALVGTNTIDIFHPTMSGMNRWGTRQAEITVVHWGSWERTANLLKGRCGHSHCARMYSSVQRRFSSGEVASTSTSSDTSL